ncbi:MAG: 3'-5' exonuclease, partial [Prevotella sp.]|nr:3'-5' exonuclease [Prevotella sp.]
MKTYKKIVVFDTETSGLCAGENVILSLSWQVLNADLVKVAEESRFFDWPEDESRIQDKAIEVNGLTKARLKELGTCNKVAALQEFAKVIDGADLLVAHNGSFDIGFVKADAMEANVAIDLSKPMFDTMLEMTDYCRIPRGNGEYKWP